MNELKSFLKYILTPGGKHGKKRSQEMSGISRLQKALGESTYDETKKAVVALARAVDSGKNWENEIDKIAKQFKVDVADLRADFEEEYGDIQKYSDNADSKGEGVARLQHVLEVTIRNMNDIVKVIKDVKFDIYTFMGSGLLPEADLKKAYDILGKQEHNPDSEAILTVINLIGRNHSSPMMRNARQLLFDVRAALLRPVSEKEMMIFTGNEEEAPSFAFKVHPADQIRAEKFLKAKKWEYTISKEELINGYVTVTVPNDYVFMDKKMGYGDMARMMSEYGIRVLKDRTKDNGHEVRTVAEKKRKHGWHGLRSSGKFSKDELDFYW
jgi:hypothetical protein